jgi:hypothetical protein
MEVSHINPCSYIHMSFAKCVAEKTPSSTNCARKSEHWYVED